VISPTRSILGEIITFEPGLPQNQSSGSHEEVVPISEPLTFGAIGDVFLRIYPDNRPKNLEIAALHKGLILGFSDAELVEEGAGFGVPIAKYGDTAYFSSSAQVSFLRQDNCTFVLRKTYSLDAVSKKDLRGVNVNDGFYKLIHKTFEAAYLGRQRLLPLFGLSMRLRKGLGVQTRFEKVKSKGEVSVTYQCYRTIIKVHVDFTGLEKDGCSEILVLNEQGAKRFREYSDSSGLMLSQGQIGPWTKVAAESASFLDKDNGVSFTLKSFDGALLFRGREQVEDRFSWAGMTYVLKPGVKNFNYTVTLGLLRADQPNLR
jgi:hypothetical protein